MVDPFLKIIAIVGVGYKESSTANADNKAKDT